MNATKITTGMDTNVQLSGSDRGLLVADPTEGETTMNSPKRLARIVGVLYLLLKHVNKSVAMAMVVLVATGAVNLAAFGTTGSNAMVLLLLDTQHYGIFIAQIFFGLWLVPLVQQISTHRSSAVRASGRQASSCLST